MTTPFDPTSFNYPLPEAIHEGQWDIRHGPPSVSIEQRLLSVPLDDTERSYHIRRHEIGRAKWFPEDVGPLALTIGCTPRTLLAIEDAVINRSCANNPSVGVPVYAPDEKNRAFLGKRVSSIPDLKNRMLSAVSLIGSMDYGTIYGMMDPRERRVLDQVEDMLHHTTAAPPKDNSVPDTCLWLEAMFEQMQDEKLSDGIESMMDLRDLSKEYTGDESDHRAKKKRGESVKNWFGNNPKKAEGDGAWYNPKFWYPPRDQRLPGRKMGRKRYAQEYGSVPKRMYRWAIDGQIFERVIKGPGGGILIDASGSMRFSSKQVYTIMAAVPNCTVAMYFGGHNDECSEYGHIVLLADKGRCVTEEVLKSHRYGGDNACDGPALRWLAKIGAPRVWVSDGYVTGPGGCTTDLLYECASICANHNIKRIPTMAQAIKFFQSGCRSTVPSYRD